MEKLIHSTSGHDELSTLKEVQRFDGGKRIPATGDAQETAHIKDWFIFSIMPGLTHVITTYCHTEQATLTAIIEDQSTGKIVDSSRVLGTVKVEEVRIADRIGNAYNVVVYEAALGDNSI